MSTNHAGVFADSHMDYEDERDASNAGQPSLTEMTSRAIDLLSQVCCFKPLDSSNNTRPVLVG